MSNPLDSYLERLRHHGQVESAGVFTLDLAKALEKLKRFRLPTPSCYLLKFVQAAVRAGAEAVRFDLRCDYVEVNFQIAGRTFDDVTETAHWLQRPDQVPEGAQQHLVMGLSSALAVSFRRLCWSVTTAEQTRYLVVDPGSLALETAGGDSALGDRSQCRLMLGRDGHGRLAQKRFVDERDTVMTRCAFAPIAIEVNRRRADQTPLPTGLLGEFRVTGQGLALPEPQLDRLRQLSSGVWVEGVKSRFRKSAWCKVYGQSGDDPCRLRMLLRIRRDRPPAARVIFDGVLSQAVGLPHPDAEAVLAGPFRADLSGLGVIADEELEKALNEVRALYKRLAGLLALHLPVRDRRGLELERSEFEIGGRLGPYRVLGRAERFLICVRDADLDSDSVLAQRVEGTSLARVRAWECLHHPNLAGVSTWSSLDQLWIVLQVKGELQNRSPNFDQGLTWARQLAAGLAALHHRSMAHLGLRPECLFLTHANDLALGPDLEHFNPRQAQERLPDPTFYSPEALSGRKDAFDDQYRWGLLAFWLLCGRAPFETSSSIETIMAHLNQPPPDPRSFGVPDGLAAIILKTLEKSPSERFASMAEVVAALALV